MALTAAKSPLPSKSLRIFEPIKKYTHRQGERLRNGVKIFKTSQLGRSSVIPGVHAETIAFTSYEQASSLVLARGWPWMGTAGQLGGRDVELQGTRQRRFRVRVTDLRERGKTM